MDYKLYIILYVQYKVFKNVNYQVRYCESLRPHIMLICFLKQIHPCLHINGLEFVESTKSEQFHQSSCSSPLRHLSQNNCSLQKKHVGVLDSTQMWLFLMIRLLKRRLLLGNWQPEKGDDDSFYISTNEINR